MIAVTHQTFGITFGLIAIIILQLVGIHPEGIGETIIFFLLVLLGSLLPDLDTTKSKLGRKLWPIAFLISLFVKHRTATHSLLFVGGVIISSGFAVIILKLTWFYALAIGGSVRKMRIYNAKEIPILKSQISQHQLRNLAFSVAQLKRPLVVYFLLISLLKHNIVFNDRTR